MSNLRLNSVVALAAALGILHSLLCSMPVDTLVSAVPWGPLVAAGGALGQSLLQFFGGKSQAEKQAESAAATASENLQLQKDAYAYQQQQNDLTRQREDTAVQRRAADLKAAGINPLLAAGSSAQAGSPSLPTAPQRENTNVAKYAMPDFMAMIQAFNQTAQTQSQVALAQAQNEAVNQRLDFNQSMNPMLLESKLLGNMGQSTTNSRLQAMLIGDNIRNKLLSNEQAISDVEVKEFKDVISTVLRSEERDYGRKQVEQMSRELDMRYQDYLFLASKGGPAAFAAKQQAVSAMLGLLSNFMPSLSPMGAGSRRVPPRVQNINNNYY